MLHTLCTIVKTVYTNVYPAFKQYTIGEINKRGRCFDDYTYTFTR